MSSNQSIQRAIWAILGTTTAAVGFAPAVMAADDAVTSNTGLEEIVVTAQRRSENIQNVPITIQAVSGEQLKSLNVTTMNDLLKYTPNVSFSGNGAPGTGNIFMRGLSSGGSGNQSQSTTAPFPNVALYLDDQSMQFPARNNDVYMVDLERVEVLEGPQGTLFGGGSQAGAVRYITNKPKLNETSSSVNAGYGVTAGGQPNSNVNATINLPLISDKLAIRATIFTDSRGGYISNVPGSIAVPPQPAPVAPATAPPGRPGSPDAGNAGAQGNDLNTVDKKGLRVSALFQFSPDWDLLLQQNYQTSEAHGYWSTEPVGTNGQVLGPFETMNFAPAFEKDRYQSTAWTLNGHLGDMLKVVYTGSYLSRHIDGQEDYSNYLRSFHGSYYACSGQGAGYAYFRSAKPTSCYAPVGSWRDQVRNTHVSHELRVSTPDDKRFRALVGVFTERFTIYDNMNFNYMGMPQCTPNNLAISLAGGPDCVAAPGPIPGFFANDPSLRENSGTAFGEDLRRGYKQTAFFGSFDFDLIPKTLTVTVGARHYKYEEFEQGSEYFSASSSVLNVPNDSVRRGFGINLHKSESGTKPRANLTWHITPDILAYATYSEGFRPGGFNRTKTLLDGTVVLASVAGYNLDHSVKQLFKPVGYDSDNLINKEVGLKTEWLNHRLQVNASGYIMDWKNVQLPLFDPTHLGNTTFDINGPTYQVKGLELQVVARVTQGLTVQGSGSWNSSNQTNTPCLRANVPGNAPPVAQVGECITQVNGQPFTNPYGVLDTAPAYSPAVQFNVRARYDYTFGEFKGFWSLGMNHTSHYRNQPESFPNGDNPNQPINTTLLKYDIVGYDTYDGGLGIAKDSWTTQLTVNNLGNNDAATSISSGQYIKQVVPLRPRVITLEFGYKF